MMSGSDQSLSTHRKSQFNLRTLLMLFFCLAVGLTIGTSPSMEFEGGFDFLTNLPGMLHEILLATGSAAISVGLIQQAWLLRRAGIVDALESNQKNMLRIAIGWRVAVAALLALCLLFEMLVARGHVTVPFPGHGLTEIFYGPVFPLYIRYACIIVVLCEYRRRISREASKHSTSFGMFGAMWGAAALLVMLIVPFNLMTNFLVYIAIGGVEAAQHVRFQRPGTYPNHQLEGFRFFWLSLAAMICLFLSGGICNWLVCNRRLGIFSQLLAGGIAVALLCLSAWYAIWYYSTGLVGISPEFAEAGFQSDWFD